MTPTATVEVPDAAGAAAPATGPPDPQSEHRAGFVRRHRLLIIALVLVVVLIGKMGWDLLH